MRVLGNWIIAILLLGTAACSHNPHKAEKIDTKIEKSSAVVDESIGVKDGNLVVQKKVEMAEALRKLQYEVYGLEDRVYGNRKYGSKGLYGALKDCRLKQSSKDLGGDGKLIWTEPSERITDKEEEFKIGIDEKEKVVGLSEEFLKDRITRFQGYKQTLQKREDEYEEKLDICDAAVKAKKQDTEKSKAAKSTTTDAE